MKKISRAGSGSDSPSTCEKQRRKTMNRGTVDQWEETSPHSQQRILLWDLCLRNLNVLKNYLEFISFFIYIYSETQEGHGVIDRKITSSCTLLHYWKKYHKISWTHEVWKYETPLVHTNQTPDSDTQEHLGKSSRLELCSPCRLLCVARRRCEYALRGVVVFDPPASNRKEAIEGFVWTKRRSLALHLNECQTKSEAHKTSVLK